MSKAICISDSSSSSSDQIQEMTQEQIKTFKTKERIQPYRKPRDMKSESKKKHKSKTKKYSSGKDRLESRQRRERNRQQRKQKKDKSKDKHASKQKKQKKEKNAKKERKKDHEMIPEQTINEDFAFESTQDRWNKQVKAVDLHKFGNAVLIKKNGRSPIHIFPAHVKEMFRIGVTWWISGQDYQGQNWPQVFKNIYEITARDLRILQSRHPAVIKQIHHVRFDSLEILYLYENNIKSIELLSRMRVPQLKDLSIRDNLITKIEPLGRMALDHLETLDIRKNHIRDISQLCHINSLALRSLSIEQKNSEVIEEDIGWLAKMKRMPNRPVTMETIQLQAKCRISQRKVDDMLGLKYNRDGKRLIKRKIE